MIDLELKSSISIGDEYNTVQAGFRMARLEVLNWGTFDRHVWRIEPKGENALLTGDIGSGKSTLVDAITTLLVPHNRIVYNKAAGAETRERTLYSYVKGEYKSAKDDLTQAAKAVFLRDENSYTVLLAHFVHQGYGQTITLAQMFWIKDDRRNPERFFVLAEVPLSITEDFTNFGDDITRFKRQLRKREQVTVCDSFKEYSTRFRRLFGIENEKALELFAQTVSLKSVGSLDHFVRHHMLEKGIVDERIIELQQSFENLRQAHAAVVKAREQIKLLTPLVADGLQHERTNNKVIELRSSRDSLSAYMAVKKVVLLEERINELKQQLERCIERMKILRDERITLRQRERELEKSIEQHGGGRLQDIKTAIERLTTERERVHKRFTSYTESAACLELPPVSDSDAFVRTATEARSLLAEFEAAIAKYDQKRIDCAIDLQELRKEHTELSEEIDSLKKRRSNIPYKNLRIRQDLSAALSITEDTIPFVGELLQVKESEVVWEGALERVLHNLALSLLVPEDLYKQVSHYVDRTHLRGRIVYHRIQTVTPGLQSATQQPNSLVHKLSIKPDTPYYHWLEQSLSKRFDYTCCNTLDEFRRHSYALTQQGQIKTGGGRHEKDDRRTVTDRSCFVLGWNNTAKIHALQGKVKQIEKKTQTIADKITLLEKTLAKKNSQRDAARDLLQYKEYREIDWQKIASEIQTLTEEKERIEQSSDILQSLQAELKTALERLGTTENKIAELGKKQGGLEQQHADSLAVLKETRQTVQSFSPESQKLCTPLLENYEKRVLAKKTIVLRNIDLCERELREALQREIDSHDKKLRQLVERILAQMKDYNNSYRTEMNEVDASVAALAEYQALLKQLTSDDLPRHEAKFKELLNKGTINGIALFQSQLDKEQEMIKKKIATINTSLREIEYNTGTFIELVADQGNDREIREFQHDLRQCLSHGLDDNQLYSEEKFKQVQAIIDRFNGREGMIDVDRRWTVKVTDVRNWFQFSAMERWQEDGTEREFYPGSAGKSGGQKEKLAYTILASALAYQFGLEWGAERSRSFRFVVIDEAFGRGSDESTRYGLELFKKLGLQLLVVTPLQKINIIEDYVKAVHFVHNDGGNCSLVKNLTQEEYRKEKEQYLASPPLPPVERIADTSLAGG